MEAILAAAPEFKKERGHHPKLPLTGQTWALLFNKSSTRTRVSFEVGIRELGGEAMFLSANDIQIGRGEPIKDTARVLGRMIHGAVIRTYAQSDVEEFAQHAGVPTVNALTDQEHPCQVLSDIFTFQERRGPIQGKVVTFIGDGACNMPMSWIFAAIKLGFELRIAAPAKYQPSIKLERLQRAAGNSWMSGGGPTEPEGNRRLDDVSIVFDARGEQGLSPPGQLDKRIDVLLYPGKFPTEEFELYGYVRPDQKTVCIRISLQDETGYESIERWCFDIPELLSIKKIGQLYQVAIHGVKKI